MKVALRWLGFLVAGLVLLFVLAAAWIWFASSRALAAEEEARPESLVQPASIDLAEAERRARTLGCLSCHGEDLTGQQFIDDPMVGRIHAPNLTAIAAKATDQQLAQAIRQGISHDGRGLFIMPSEAYQFLSDAETAQLILYIRSRPRKGSASPPLSVGPLGRIGLVTGELGNTPQLAAEYRARPAPDLGPAVSAGRHLALTTCTGCHGSDLSGRVVSPEIDAPSLDIAGAYDLDSFKRLLREGVAPPGRKVEVMGRVARDDLRFYTDDEIASLHAYLVALAQR